MKLTKKNLVFQRRVYD